MVLYVILLKRTSICIYNIRRVDPFTLRAAKRGLTNVETVYLQKYLLILENI